MNKMGVIKIKAVIMSGGKGTRLRPLTCQIPKPMVPIFNKPVMEYIIKLLKSHNIYDIAVTLHYLPNEITEYFNEGEKYGVHMSYFIEDVPLGTGGSVKNAKGFLDSTFLVISGDAFTNIDITKAVKFHKENNSKATLILKKEPIPLEYGVVITGEDGRIKKFLEKPGWGEVFSDTINTGIYILEPEVMNYYKAGENFDFGKDLFPRLLKDGIPMYGYITSDYWCDVGDLHSYMNTHVDFLEKKVFPVEDAEEVKKGIWIGKGTIVEEGAQLFPPVYIGKNTIVKKGSKIYGCTIIGDNCYLGENTSVKKSILWKNVHICNNAEIRKSVLCDGVRISDRVRIFENSVIGTSAVIKDKAVIKSNVKVWPEKRVERDMVVKNDLIWGTGVSKNIFGKRGVSGIFNQDITTEFSSKLGGAFASLYQGKSLFVIASDEKDSSQIIKNALNSGVVSAGGRMVDIRVGTVPMVRYAVNYLKGDGGIFVSCGDSNSDTISIEFFDDKGKNIDRTQERKIENEFSIGDFNRTNGDKIKDIIEISNFSSLYLKYGEEILDHISSIKEKRPKIVIGSKSKYIIDLAEKYLKNIGCDTVSILEEELKEIKEKIISVKGDMGIIVFQNGENIILIDHEGNFIKDEKYNFLTFLIGLETKKIKNIVIPYNFPRTAVSLAENYGGSISITKTNVSEIMKEMEKDDSHFQYILSFDALFAAGKIIDYISYKNIKLKDIALKIPDFHFIKKEIPCKWEDKGKIVRLLSEDKKQQLEMFEGVRFLDKNGWALILPDIEKPTFNLYAEGSTEEFAEEISVFYYEKIKRLLEDKR